MMDYCMSFTFKLRKAPTTICSLTLVGATLAPSTPVFEETQQPQTTDSQEQPAVIAQEDLSTLNQVEGNATHRPFRPRNVLLTFLNLLLFIMRLLGFLTVKSRLVTPIAHTTRKIILSVRV